MAADSEIRVVITGVASDLRAALAGAKGDLGDLKTAIREVPNKIKIDVAADTLVAIARLRDLQLMAGKVPDRINITATADTGIASAKLDLLQAKIRDTERAAARASLGRAFAAAAGGGGLIGGAGILASPFGGGVPAAAIGGGLAAVGPVLGAGAMAASGAGALAIGGLLPLLTLVKPAIGDISSLAAAFTNLQQLQELYGSNQAGIAKAQNAYNAAVAAFGPSSKAAIDAHAKLVLAQHAVANSAPQIVAQQNAINKMMLELPPSIVPVAKAWAQLGSVMNDTNQAIMPALAKVLTPLMKTVTALVPTLQQMAVIDLGGIARGLKPIEDMMQGGAFKALLIQLSDIFAKLAPIMFSQLQSILLIWMRTAVAAGPAMLALSNAFAGLLKQFAAFTATSTFKTMLGQWTDSFVALLAAVLPLIPPLLNIATALVPSFTLVLRALTPVITMVLVPALNLLADVLRTKFGQALAIAALVLLPGGGIMLGLAGLGLAISHLKEILKFFAEAWKTAWQWVKTAFDNVLNFLLGGISTLLGAIKSVLDTANISLPLIGHVFGSNLTSVSRSLAGAQASIDSFRKTLQPASDTAKQTTAQIAQSYATMSQNVERYLFHMISATTAGLTTVDKRLVDELGRLGIKPTAAVLQGLHSMPGQPGSFPALTAAPAGKAGGGLIQVGRPGEKGRDTVPMSVGGQGIVVGAGEQVAVFNHEQQQVMNQRLADIGGLPGMFARHNRPHYMAAGGVVGSGATGGASGSFMPPLVTIATPAWSGPGGIAAEIGTRIIDIAAAGANQVVKSQFGALGTASSSGGAPPGSYPGSLAAWLTRALQITNHMSPGNLAALAGRAMQESGGNPHAINLWDSNAKAGHPSKGLLQTIDSTFSTYALPGHGDIWNPIDNAIAAIRYMFARYGHIVGPSGSGYAQGGIIPGFAGGGVFGTDLSRYRPPAVHSHAGSHPPKARAITHPKSPKIHVPKTISDSLKNLLGGDVTHDDTVAARYAQHQVDLSNTDSQLTYTQGLAPFPAQPLVTLTDADVAFMDPAGSLGYQVGDQLVNQGGMTVGRFFGPTGIEGGSYVPGINQRMGQIGAQLMNLYGQQAAVGQAGAWYGKAAVKEWQARQQRERRRARVLSFLRKSVIHAKAIQAELAAITTGNLKANLAKALSKQAVAKRLGQLGTQKTQVAGELLAERQSQSALPSLERDPTHTDALATQLQGINDAISVENQLSRGVGAGQAVQASRSAIFKDSLKNRLAAYATVDKQLGGSPYDVGTGGIIGQLVKEISALDANRATDLSNKTALAPALQQIGNAIGAYLTERQGLPGTKSIQVRAPGGSAATVESLSAQLALQTTVAQNAAQTMALSQAQFGTLSGFVPLLTGRLLGSFASGIDSVPQTGPYLLHRGETIIPDPAGPYGNRAAAQVQTAQGPVDITIEFANNDVPLVKIVKATMNNHALQVVTQKAGQRARLMSGVRRS